MEQLKFLTCGSVDDGKSTLIGHMLYEAKLIFADQENSLLLDSKVNGHDGVDYSLLLDGLEDERRQGITIDVAYRFFHSQRRSFIVADCPGHEEYTHNMAVGARFADLAIILVDAYKGVLPQTRRHLYICNMMGIKDIVFAVNKMDLVNYDEDRFCSIRKDLDKLLKEIESDSPVKTNSVIAIPLSGKMGDNLVENSKNMSWYRGKPLLKYLEEIEIKTEGSKEDNFILPVQSISKKDGQRYYLGQLNSGIIEKNDEVIVLPSNTHGHITGIFHGFKEEEKSLDKVNIAVTVDKELDISRGNILVRKNTLITGNSFVGKLLTLGNCPLESGSRFRFALHEQEGGIRIRKILYRINIMTGEKEKTDVLKENEIGVAELEYSGNLVFDTFEKNRELGEFIFMDEVSHETSAYGTVLYPLNQEGKPFYQKLSIDRKTREERYHQSARTYFFTGLSCAGKSSIANELEKKLFEKGIHTMILDGDNMRLGLCKDLGFSSLDRKENIRRVAEVARLLNDAGVTVLCCFVSPFIEDRKMAREIIGESYMEIYVEASLNTCQSRDKKGNYIRALRGEIKDFTGISSPYEIPENPEIKINTDHNSIEECVIEIMKQIGEEK